MVVAAVAKPLLNMKLRLAAVKALREAVLNNLGRTIVCLKKLLMFHVGLTEKEKKKVEATTVRYMVFAQRPVRDSPYRSAKVAPGILANERASCHFRCEHQYHWAPTGYPAGIFRACPVGIRAGSVDMGELWLRCRASPIVELVESIYV